MLEMNFETFPELETQRLLLRQFNLNDTEHYHRLRTDPESMRFMDTDPPKNIEVTREKIKHEVKAFTNGDSIYWALELQGSSEFIGGAGFWRIIKQHYRAEIGYQILPEFWRQGYAEEALRSIISFGFEKMGLHSIEANVNPKNIPSINLLKKIGFNQEAYFKENFYFNGKFLDSVIFSLLETN